MLSREFLVERGYCCGHGCLMCPYIPKHKKGNINMSKYPSIKKVIYWWWKFWNFTGIREEPIPTKHKHISINKKYKEVYIDNRN